MATRSCTPPSDSSSFLCHRTFDSDFRSSSPPPQFQELDQSHESVRATPVQTPRNLNMHGMLGSRGGGSGVPAMASSLCTPQPSRAELELKQKLDFEVTSISANMSRTVYPAITQLSDYLFIGAFPTEETISTLQNLGITHVINCCAGQRRSPEVEERFSVALFDTRDEPDYFILAHHHEEFVSLIDEVRRVNGKVFVHCIAGVNRSATLCVGYLMDRCHMCPLEAVRLFRRQGRTIVLDNVGFRHQVVDHFLALNSNGNQ